MISNNSITNLTELLSSNSITEVFCDCTGIINNTSTILGTHINTIYLVLFVSLVFLVARICFKLGYIQEKHMIQINRYVDIVYFGSAFFLWSHIVMLQSMGVI